VRRFRGLTIAFNPCVIVNPTMTDEPVRIKDEKDYPTGAIAMRAAPQQAARTVAERYRHEE
jgi:hypothetical protein